MGRRTRVTVATTGFFGRLRRLVRRLALIAVGVVLAYLLVCLVVLGAVWLVDPPTTALQVQRRVEAWGGPAEYDKRYEPVPLARIADHLEHAVVAAEDARFYEHAGVDWRAIETAVEDNLERGRAWRGGSTITQQLVKNLFLTTRGSWVRKGLEVPLAYMADLVLPKERILELYVNVIEWGPGVYGAEAAARHHFGVSAAALDRHQAAALAACIPRPRRCSPQRATRSRDVILRRMAQMGW